MKIEFPNNDEENIKSAIENFDIIKFAAFKKTGERVRNMVLLLFTQKPSSHYDIVKKRLEDENAGEEFIGAGFIHGTRFSRWDSESCKKHIGHDRPKSDSMQAMALGEIHKAVRGLVQKNVVNL